DIEAALDRLHRDDAVRQRGAHLLEVDLVGLLNADRDVHEHAGLGVDLERAQHGERGVVERVLHRAQGGLGVVAAMQVVAGAELEDDAFLGHHRSSLTMAAAWAITVLSVPASFMISRPPCITFTVPVPCGSTFSTSALSTLSGCGTPINTSTCMSSLDLPTAVATVSELCHSASLSARTAALV